MGHGGGGLAVVLMMGAAAPVASFINRHFTVKILALSLLLLIGMTLIADGFGMYVPKGHTTRRLVVRRLSRC